MILRDKDKTQKTLIKHIYYISVAAYRIHISNDTYTDLVLFGGFRFEERGLITVKVKITFVVNEFSFK